MLLSLHVRRLRFVWEYDGLDNSLITMQLRQPHLPNDPAQKKNIGAAIVYENVIRVMQIIVYTLVSGYGTPFAHGPVQYSTEETRVENA